jgi:hypothetical protein
MGEEIPPFFFKMINKEDLIAKGFIEVNEKEFTKTYSTGVIIINGQPQQSSINFKIVLDNSENNELGSYIEFYIYADDVKRWILGRTGYYTDIADLQKDAVRLRL